MRRLFLASLILVLSGGYPVFSRAANNTLPARVVVQVQNTLGIARTDETVEIAWATLSGKLPGVAANSVRVLDAGTSEEVVSQVLDLNADGTPESLLFQASLWPGQTRSFAIEAQAPARKPKSRVFAMHMPERDDVAWENDRIGFRTYGMGLQKLENLVSSGIDIWTKRTRNLVIEKWYGKKAPANYHTDTGEGADFYKVGPTLGAGGTAVWRNGKLYRPENFISQRILANGPIRAVFELEHRPFDAGGVQVSETKRISIDAGQNFFRQESTFRVNGGETLTFATGIVKREGLVGSTRTAKPWTWLTAWGPVDRAAGGHGELGHAILVEQSRLADMKEIDDHYLALFSAKSGEPVTLYIGAGWTATGDFDRVEDWWTATDNFAARLAAPLVVRIGSES